MKYCDYNTYENGKRSDVRVWHAGHVAKYVINQKNGKETIACDTLQELKDKLIELKNSGVQAMRIIRSTRSPVTRCCVRN